MGEIVQKLSYSLDKGKDLLRINLHKVETIPGIKFVRREKRKTITTQIATYPVNIPFTTRIEKYYVDCTKFHSDEIEYERIVKEYNEPELTNFINYCLGKHILLTQTQQTK